MANLAADAAGVTGVPMGSGQLGSGINGERLHALDAARAAALLLGVVFHASMAYLPGPQIWFVQDDTAPAMALIFYVSHIFRMALFFLLAGFFARMMLHRKGTGAFVANRAKRIAVPLVVGWPIVFIAIIACFIYGFNQSVPPGTEPPPSPPMTAQNFPLTHLWFLYVLIIFYAAAMILRGVVVALDRKENLREGLVDPVVRFLAGSPVGLLFLAAPIAAVFIATPDWYYWFGVPTPDHGLVPNTVALVTFGTVFAFGWLLQRQMELLEKWRRLWPAYLFLAIALTAGCLYLVGTQPLLVPAAGDWKEIAYACGYALAIWCWVAGLIGFAMQIFSKANAIVRYVADASYWIYIAHLPVVMALQAAFLKVDLPVWPKFAVLNGVVFVIMFLSYALLVRHSFVGAILNGKRPRGNRSIQSTDHAASAV